MTARTPRWPVKIEMLLTSNRLAEQTVSRQSIAALWRKAVESARDAELKGMSMDGSLRSAYDAGHMAALALLAANNLRPTSGQGHHEIAFAGAAALGDPALHDLVPDSEELRGLRSASMYDPVIAQPEDQVRALKWMRKTLPVIRASLVGADPKLKSLLIQYP